MDEYFGALNTQSTFAFGEGREELLEGISNDLRKGANNALDAVEMLQMSQLGIGIGADYDGESAKKEVAGLFREFADADIDYNSNSSLQRMIEGYEKIWHDFADKSKVPLDRSLLLLRLWRGEGAEAAKTYITELVNVYGRVGTKLTVLESDLVAAREAVATARFDLTKLSFEFKVATEKYLREKENLNEALFYKVLAAGFAAAVTGLLAVATAGIAAPAGAAVWTAAQGALIAGQTAGAALAVGIEGQGQLTGDNPRSIYKSFMDNVDLIREGMFRTADTLVSRIRTEINDLPVIPEPPDVSPGETFDPENFETDKTDKGTEKRVRDRNIDISEEGEFQEPPRELSPLE
ncbi:hypothetical protein [Amycolatopsis alba]|uniref:Uncharacterized protein n=1 Tax=Amycolatopsis alba DSM 44262 TaxID=1125972 RepID=A0A229RYC8_AMYAL|nr:hypothetical protein [Amycolatopsis alba]OXM51501.1 hypothetical protein CFP75_13735 [Amycolatopsis alba DSM 44262]